MNTQEKLFYAQSRLSLAKAMKDTSEIEKWTEHVDYWRKRIQEEAKVNTGEICSSCGGRGSTGFGETFLECERCNGTGEI